ncbi:MAG: ferritin [bacterium]|nr:ferritin [bacterium]
MLDPKLEKAINQQINNEFGAWYTYLGMATYFDGLYLIGFAKFMEEQAREEQTHAQRLFRYVLDRGGEVDLQPIPAPKVDYTSIKEAFNKAVEQEKANTASIYELYALSKDCNDYATIAALQWFLDEQVEEEKIMTDALGLLEFAGEDKSALLALNNQFGERKFDAEAEGGAE